MCYSYSENAEMLKIKCKYLVNRTKFSRIIQRETNAYKLVLAQYTTAHSTKAHPIIRRRNECLAHFKQRSYFNQAVILLDQQQAYFLTECRLVRTTRCYIDKFLQIITIQACWILDYVLSWNFRVTTAYNAYLHQSPLL